MNSEMHLAFPRKRGPISRRFLPGLRKTLKADR